MLCVLYLSKSSAQLLPPYLNPDPFAWQAWHLWHWAGSGGALGPRWSPGRRGTLCGIRGTWRHPRSICVADVALRDIHVPLARLVPVGRTGRRGTLRGRRGTYGTGLDLVARFDRPGRRGTLRGRRGTWRHPPSFLRGRGMQGWHLATSTFVLRGTQLFHTHTQLFHFHIHFFFLSILHHLLCLSFLPRPASTVISHYWKKLTYGVIGSFNSFLLLRSPPRVPGR